MFEMLLGIILKLCNNVHEDSEQANQFPQDRSTFQDREDKTYQQSSPI